MNYFNLKKNMQDFMSKIPLDGAPLTSSKEIKLNQ